LALAVSSATPSAMSIALVSGSVADVIHSSNTARPGTRVCPPQVPTEKLEHKLSINNAMDAAPNWRIMHPNQSFANGCYRKPDLPGYFEQIEPLAGDLFTRSAGRGRWWRAGSGQIGQAYRLCYSVDNLRSEK
jgi:hypothetical protein